MSIAESMLGLTMGSPANQSQRDMQDALLRYFTLKEAGDITGSALDHITGKSGMQDEDMRLGIALKKKQLGMGDSADFNDQINGDGHSILSSLGISFLDRLQSPKAIPKLAAHIAEGSPYEPIYRIGRAVSSSAPRKLLSRAIGSI